MPEIVARSDYAAWLLAMGLTPQEAAARLRQRVGITYSADYLADVRFEPQWRQKIEHFKPYARKAALAALIGSDEETTALAS